MIRVSIETTGALFEGRAPEIVEAGLLSAMHEAVMFLEREVKAGTPQGVYGVQGGLISTIHGEVEGRGTPVIKGIVAHSSKYGDVIEKGRTPGKGMPPEGSLVRWMEEKLGMDEAKARRLEYVVRRKIGREGFPGAGMFAKALEKNEAALQRIFEKHGFKMAERISQ